MLTTPEAVGRDFCELAKSACGDGVPCFAPIKNRKEHDVPLAASLAQVLARHVELPPVPVTSAMKVPDGDPATFHLVVTRPYGRPWKGLGFDQRSGTQLRTKQGSHHLARKRRSARLRGTRGYTHYAIRRHPYG